MIKPRQAKEFSVLMTPRALSTMFLLTFLFILATLVLQNPSLFVSLLLNPWNLTAKTHILLSLITGLLFTTPLTFFIMTAAGLLTGAHLALARKQALLGTCSLLGAGCSACGISLFSTLGLFSLAFLPLGGQEIGLASVLTLLITLVFK